MLATDQARRLTTSSFRRASGGRGRAGLLLSYVLLAAVSLFASAPAAFAQGTTSGTVRGVVKDPAGAVVPNASVTLIGQRGDERKAATSDAGVYVFTSVDPGAYTLRVESQGFKTFEQQFTLAPTETRGLDAALEVGAPTETVTVTDQGSALKTETGERSETITSAQIENLSIISRSSLELLRILPGVVPPDPSDPNSGIDRVSFGGGANATANYTVNGIRGVNNNVSIDGSRVVDIGSNNGTIITPNVDMVQEVTVKTSNYAAEYGSGGVQISATTKGGTKDFHGALYYYFRPNSLQANDRSNSILRNARPETDFKYPGGNIGGPIILPGTKFNRDRDKLFFFVGFEVQRQRPDRGSRLGTVPTLAERNGDFSQSPSRYSVNINGQPVSGLSPAQGGVICPPDTIGWAGCTSGNGGVGLDGGVRNPVPNGNLTAFRNPIGAALLNLYPLPNFVPDPGSTLAAQRRNYASNIIAPIDRTDLKMRFDYKVTNNTNMYLRLAREAESDDAPYGIWWGPSSFELPSHVVGDNWGRSAAVNITSVISPTMTNEFVFSASKGRAYYDYADPSKVSKSALGIANLQTPLATGALAPRSATPYAPLQLISWESNNANLWQPGGLPLFAVTGSTSASDTLSKVYNNHTLKIGFLVERATKFQNVQSNVEGQINFEADQARSTGNAFANLYTGRINGFDQSTTAPEGRYRLWNLEGYAQDSFKILPNLTVEYGARLSYFGTNQETTGLGAVFDPTVYQRDQGAFLTGANGQVDLSRPNGFLLESRGEIPAGVYDQGPGIKIGPRLNLAWDMFGNGSTVLRGGAGVFYNRVQGNYQYAVQTLPPNYLTVHADSWGAPNNDITLDNIARFNPLNIPPGANCRVVGSGVSGVGCPGGFTTQNRHENSIPRITTASLSLARRLPWSNVAEVSYVGTFGRHLPQRRGINFILNPLTSGQFGNDCSAPNPQNCADLSNPVHRAAVANNPAAMAQLLPYPAYAGNGGGIQVQSFDGTSNYHSMQFTLNRQLGRDLQYFLTYTFSKALGTTGVNESAGNSIVDPINTRERSYGLLPYDRTHIFNLSYNYNFPDLARGGFRNWFTKGALNGWQMSGITTAQSGRPIYVRFTGAITGSTVLFSSFGHNAAAGGDTPGSSGIAPVILRNPTTGNTNVNGSYLDVSAFQIPSFGTSGPYQSPFYIRSPTTTNWDVTFFKNFSFSEDKKLQFRLGLFNLFNQAFPNPDLGDIGGLNGPALALNTRNVINPATGACYRVAENTPTGTGRIPADTTLCDPTRGFEIDPNAINTFGRIVNKHGHRRVELAFKFYF